MRWIPIWSTAVVVVGALATTAEVAGAPPPFEAADSVADRNCGAPPHAVGMRASWQGEPPWGPPPGPGNALEGPLPPYLHGLALSDDQQDRIFDLLHEQAPAARQLLRSLQKSRSQLHELGLSDKYDESAVRTLADAQSKAEGDLAVLRAHTDHEIRVLLTAEQRKQMATDARDPGAHDRPGPGPGHGAACWR
jgi:Spy/CpxP family protein refolding chaperone